MAYNHIIETCFFIKNQIFSTSSIIFSQFLYISNAAVDLSEEKLLANLFIDDTGVVDDVLSKALDDDCSSIYKIGEIYCDREEYTKAIDWFRLSAAKNHARSQFIIGCMYEIGRGVSVDFKLVMKWYLKAQHNGSMDAADSIDGLNNLVPGYCTDDRQDRCLQPEKNLEQKKSKTEAAESQLKESEQKRLQSDGENKLLQQK